jgi:hypothetical protein
LTSKRPAYTYSPQIFHHPDAVPASQKKIARFKFQTLRSISMPSKSQVSGFKSLKGPEKRRSSF